MERDPSFVFNGAYTPAVCRIVSAVAAAANSPNPDVANADLMNLVPGHKVCALTEIDYSRLGVYDHRDMELATIYRVARFRLFLRF